MKSYTMEEKSYSPIINDTQYPFSPRDSLGIESVAASISAELCPIVNTVTPRAFYWPFMAWIYYDFYQNSGIKKYDRDTFNDGFLKRQDYFFVLASLIDNHQDQQNLVGKQNTSRFYAENPEGPFLFNKNYFQPMYGGMQYYNAGCLTMRLITQNDDINGRHFTFPRVTQLGEQMALAFENVIKDTEYYKNYRLKNVPVPKSVLVEYGNVINLGMKGFDECKSLLRHHLFDLNPRLRNNAEYLKFINKEYGKQSLSYPEARHILFDYFSPRGYNRTFPIDLQEIIKGWEIIIGRQYFTCGIEMIWKFMLSELSTPLSFESWAIQVIEHSSIKQIKKQTVNDFMETVQLNYDEREQMISQARLNKETGKMVENGLKVALSLYQRFRNREDLGETAPLLDYGRGKLPGMGSLSFNEWITLVERFREKTVEEFLVYIMKSYIVDQHRRTCYDKLTRFTNRVDGFYFECIDNMYVKNEHEFQIDFQGIRLIQLMQVMKDLDMIKDETD